MISAQIQGAEKAVIFLTGSGDRVRAAMRTAFARIAISLQRYIVTQKLHGQVLKQRTGTLASSVIQRVEESDGKIVAIVQAGGGTAGKYAGVHEYGGTYTIPEHLSVSRLGNQFSVRSHDATFPVRSYMRSSLQENLDMYVTEVNKALKQALTT